MSDTYGCFLGALCVVGLTGNTLTLVVLRCSSKQHKSTYWTTQVHQLAAPDVDTGWLNVPILPSSSDCKHYPVRNATIAYSTNFASGWFSRWWLLLFDVEATRWCLPTGCCRLPRSLTPSTYSLVFWLCCSSSPAHTWNGFRQPSPPLRRMWLPARRRCTWQVSGLTDTPFTLMRFKPLFSAVLLIFSVGGRLRLSCGRSRKVYVLISVNKVSFTIFEVYLLFVSCGSLRL